MGRRRGVDCDGGGASSCLWGRGLCNVVALMIAELSKGAGAYSLLQLLQNYAWGTLLSWAFYCLNQYGIGYASNM